MAGELHEKCGVAGVVAAGDYPNQAAIHTYDMLIDLQHRGAEAAGIISRDTGQPLVDHLGAGKVLEVFNDERSLAKLVGQFATGHVRYATSGNKSGCENAHPQPVFDEYSGVVLAENGNDPDTSSIDGYLSHERLLYRHLNDSERKQLTISQKVRKGADFPAAIKDSYRLFNGAFSCVGMHDNLLAAFRDEYGIRPLELGRLNDAWLVSSETCAIEQIGGEHIRPVEPGELITIDDAGSITSEQLAEPKPNLDIFEFVYFSAGNSLLYDKTVSEVRRRIGQELAAVHGHRFDNPENMVVVPVPDTPIPMAEGLSQALGANMIQALLKNRGINKRTFQQPTNDLRKQYIQRKYSPIGHADGPLVGKDVIVVDDSIVRLNTVRNVVPRIKAAGARSVTVLIGSPPVRFPDFYGIDTPTQKELAAANLTVKQMEQEIPECSFLGFLPLQNLIQATQVPAHKLNLSCFNGVYPIPIGRHQKEINYELPSWEYIE